MAVERRTRGFWRGLLTGLLLVIGLALVGAWLFPPLRAPVVTVDSLEPPSAPAMPDGTVPEVPQAAVPDEAGAVPDAPPEAPVPAPALDAPPDLP